MRRPYDTARSSSMAIFFVAEGLGAWWPTSRIPALQGPAGFFSTESLPSDSRSDGLAAMAVEFTVGDRDVGGYQHDSDWHDAPHAQRRGQKPGVQQCRMNDVDERC